VASRLKPMSLAVLRYRSWRLRRVGSFLKYRRHVEANNHFLLALVFSLRSCIHRHTTTFPRRNTELNSVTDVSHLLQRGLYRNASGTPTNRRANSTRRVHLLGGVAELVENMGSVSQAAKNCSGIGSVEPSGSAFFPLTGCFLHPSEPAASPAAPSATYETCFVFP
jgi:hypothetical protein